MLYNPYNPTHVKSIVIVCIALAILKLIILLFSFNKKDNNDYVFAYCDGATSKVVCREYVSKDVFDSYDVHVGYPVLNVGRSIIYFNIR